jgi:hypothetical protein
MPHTLLTNNVTQHKLAVIHSSLKKTIHSSLKKNLQPYTTIACRSIELKNRYT